MKTPRWRRRHLAVRQFPECSAERSSRARAVVVAVPGYDLQCNRVLRRKPRSTSTRRERLCTSSPAPTSSTRVNAISATTSPFRSRRCPGSAPLRCPWDIARVFPLIVRVADAPPKPAPMTTTSSATKPTTRASSDRSWSRGTSAGPNVTTSSSAAAASTTPATAANPATSTLSVINCRANPLPAPAQGGSDRELAPPPAVLREHQVRGVYTSNEQEEDTAPTSSISAGSTVAPVAGEGESRAHRCPRSSWDSQSPVGRRSCSSPLVHRRQSPRAAAARRRATRRLCV